MKLTNSEIHKLFEAHVKVASQRFALKPKVCLKLARNLRELRAKENCIIEDKNALVVAHSGGADKVDEKDAAAMKAFREDVDALFAQESEVELTQFPEVDLQPIADISILEGLIPIIES